MIVTKVKMTCMGYICYVTYLIKGFRYDKIYFLPGQIPTCLFPTAKYMTILQKDYFTLLTLPYGQFHLWPIGSASCLHSA